VLVGSRRPASAAAATPCALRLRTSAAAADVRGVLRDGGGHPSHGRAARRWYVGGVRRVVPGWQQPASADGAAPAGAGQRRVRQAATPPRRRSTTRARSEFGSPGRVADQCGRGREQGAGDGPAKQCRAPLLPEVLLFPETAWVLISMKYPAGPLPAARVVMRRQPRGPGWQGGQGLTTAGDDPPHQRSRQERRLRPRNPGVPSGLRLRPYRGRGTSCTETCLAC
jgi:hypothetical protein